MTNDTAPTIRVQIDLSPQGVRNVLVYADTPEDRDKALGWLTAVLPQVELLEAFEMLSGAFQMQRPKLYDRSSSARSSWPMTS